MDEEPIRVTLPELDRETFGAQLSEMERIADRMQPSELRDRITAHLVETRNRFNTA
jgi:hypothetical protein